MKKPLIPLIVAVFATFTACEKPEESNGDNDNANQPVNIILSQAKIKVSAEAQAIDVGVTCPVEYKVIPKVEYSWCLAKITETGVTFTVQENKDSEERISEWTFSCGTVTAPFELTQSGKAGEDNPGNDGRYIYYTTVDNTTIAPISVKFSSSIKSNTYENGVGCIEFEEPLTSIGQRAFSDCTSLTSIAIPSSVTSMPGDAFAGCTSLASFFGELATSDGRCLVKEGELLAFAPAGLTEYSIPSGVTAIGFGAFSGCSLLTGVEISQGVTSIGESAFAGCTSLTQFSGELATSDGRCLVKDGKLVAFAPAGLTEYTIPSNVTSIGNWVLSGCSLLTGVEIPQGGVTTIGEYAFGNCSALASMAIPPSVTSIGVSAFYRCSSLRSFSGNLATSDGRCLIKDGKLLAFAPAGLTAYTIPSNVTLIGDGAFRGCSSLTSIEIPSNVTSIGEHAFWNCSSLTSIYCKPATPPAGGNNMFGLINCTIYVPTASVDEYKAATYWANYASNIEGYNF